MPISGPAYYALRIFYQSVQTTHIQSAESFAWQIGLGRANVEEEFDSFNIKTNVAGCRFIYVVDILLNSGWLFNFNCNN